jgi:transposase
MMGWMAPLRHRRARLVFLENHQEREPSMSEITTIGLDLAKHVFQVHGIDARGTTVLRKRLRRGQVLAFFSRIPRCVVGLEACATAHYWARELGALGHEVRLMPAQYVKAYIKRNKHDAADAEAICEAVQRPTMRFVPVKTAEQQANQLLHRGREQLVRQRTMLVNALRAHLAEFGMVAAQGLRNVGELIAIVRDDGDRRLPAVARQVLQVLANQIEQIEAAVRALERAAACLAQDEPCESAAGQHSRHWPHHRHGHCHDGGRADCLSLRTGVRGVARLGAAAEFNRRENPAGRDHEAR